MVSNLMNQILTPLTISLILIVIVMSITLVVLWFRQKKLVKLIRLSSQVYTSENNNTYKKSNSIAESDKRFAEKADEAQRLQQTFQKFVPKQFVDHFSQSGSKSGALELGRANEDDMAVLFCDIRGFASLSEDMQPQELMNFLNSYFLRMNDPIHQNKGFIDKFIGDAIMALFDHPGGNKADKAFDAVNAAIDLYKALELYNSQRAKANYAAIRIGIGIHIGPVIIGTVGSDDRMDTTVIGDSVNLSSRLESLAPQFSADIVVTEALIKNVKAHPEANVKYRILDFIRVKGRKSPLEVYEILNHLDEKTQDLRVRTSEFIEQGIALRKAQKWRLAIAAFQQALIVDPTDELIIHHLEQCHRLSRNDYLDNWDGAFTVH